MVNRKTVSALAIAALLSCAIPVRSLASGLLAPIIGQAVPSFPVPATVNQGTEIVISSSSDSMNAISEALSQGFEESYDNSKVAVETKAAIAAIQDVLNGNADLAAISRPLTAEEKSKGLIAVPVRREKIAIVVDQSNPFAQSITGDQFAKIFRGEITDWSAVGGAAGTIKLVDRPETSEIRQALSPYPVFTTAPFEAADGATVLEPDSSEALTQALGANGIGYVLVGELESNPSLKPLKLHQTLPTDPKYPFSQPYAFVYAGGASPEVAAFLGYATGNPGQAIVNAAGISGPDADATESRPGNNSTIAEGENAADEEGAADPSSITARATSGTDGDTLAATTAGLDGILGTDDDIQGIDPAGPDGLLGTDDDIEVLNDPAGPDGVLGTADDIEVFDGEAAGLDAIAGKGRWWWLLLPLAGLGLFIWAAGKRGSEEEAGYSVNTDSGDGIGSNYEPGRVGGRGSAGSDGPDTGLATAGKVEGTGLDKMTAGSAAIAGGTAAAGTELASQSTGPVDNMTMGPRNDMPNTADSIKGNDQGGNNGVKADIQSGFGVSVSGLRNNAQGDIDVVEGNVQIGIDSTKGSAQDSIDSNKEAGDSWLDRAKQRINEATDQVKDTAGDIQDDITRED